MYSCASRMLSFKGNVPNGTCCVPGDLGTQRSRVGEEFTADGVGGYFKQGERCFSGALCEHKIVRICLDDSNYEIELRLESQRNGVWRLSEVKNYVK